MGGLTRRKGRGEEGGETGRGQLLAGERLKKSFHWNGFYCWTDALIDASDSNKWVHGSVGTLGRHINRC